MRSRIVLLFMLALFCAAGAAYLVMKKVQQMEAPAAAAPAAAQTQPILIATRNLSTGTVIAQADVRVMDWPAQSWPVGGMAPDSIVFGETVVKLPIAQNTPIIDTQVTHKGLGGSLAYVLPPGRVAMTIGVTEITGVAGHVGPGNFVDVLFTHQSSLAPNVGYSDGDAAPVGVTETLLVHIKVLAVDQLINDINPEIAVVKSVTLEVSTKEAEILVLAETLGRLSLALNSAVEPTAGDLLQLVDVRRGPVPSFTMDNELSAVYSPLEAEPGEEEEVESAGHTVFIFRGTAVQEISLPGTAIGAGQGEGPEGELLDAAAPAKPDPATEAQGDADEASPAQPTAQQGTAGDPQSVLPQKIDLRRGSS
ncbi:MAG TPA: Flp pilus assembly protein CpaB [Kiloniellales bacterium]|nr:Flp pilus assembly protein CpaB [Kiloniellales bacterium]